MDDSERPEALRTLEELMSQMPVIRSKGRFSTDFVLWRAASERWVHQFHGPHSLLAKQTASMFRGMRVHSSADFDAFLDGPEDLLKSQLKRIREGLVSDNQVTPTVEQKIIVFISHSSRDLEIAKSLIELLRYAIPRLDPASIRCTSVPGYKLEGGAWSGTQLRKELLGAVAFFGLLTKESLASTYVLFELGARWGAGTGIKPLRAAGLPLSELRAPLTEMHVPSCDEETDLHQTLEEISKLLVLPLLGAHVYGGHLKRLLELSNEQAQSRSATSPPEIAQRKAGNRFHKVSDNDAHVFFTVVAGQLTDTEIKVLDFLAKGFPKGFNPWNAADFPNSARNYGAAIQMHIPELAGQLNRVDLILTNLRSRGLSNLSSPNAPYPQSAAITNPGLEFLRFISDEP